MRTSPYSSTGLNHWFQGRTWLWAVARAPQWFTLPSSAELLWWSWGPNDSLGIKRAWFTSNSDQRSSAWLWPSQNTEMQFWNTAVNTMRLPSSVPRTGLCFATLRMSLWHSSEPFLNLLGAPFRCHPQGLPWDSVLPRKSSCPWGHRLCQQPPTQELWCPQHLLSLPGPWFPSCVLEITPWSHRRV